MDPGNTAMNEALREMFETGKYSDMTISCDEESFKVHKAIVSSRSPVLARYCARDSDKTFKSKGGGRECVRTKATDQDPMDLYFVWEGEDPLGSMLEFIYLHDYTAKYEDLEEHAVMYRQGQKFKIPSLKQAALYKFHEELRTKWSSYAFSEVVDTHFFLHDKCLEKKNDLQDMIIETLHHRREELACYSKIQRYVRTVDGLADALRKLRIDEGPRRCPICGPGCTLYRDFQPAKKRKRLAIAQGESNE